MFIVRPPSCQFLSTPSARRATTTPPDYQAAVGNFYPRPPRGGRLNTFLTQTRLLEFLSTPSARRATSAVIKNVPCLKCISIHALREEGDNDLEDCGLIIIGFLSTPSARRATSPPGMMGGYDHISIHALREEGDGCADGRFQPYQDFYPRPPRGGRPVLPHGRLLSVSDFYPRPPRGGRPCENGCGAYWEDISIHALREEGDPSSRNTGRLPRKISIHALREEGDQTSPCFFHHVCGFLSTPSARRAT